MGDDITIGVTEIVNNIEVTAQPNDQIVDISVVDNTDVVTLNVTPTVIEINVNKGSSYAKWGTITGTLTYQSDLVSTLALKADLVAGKVPSSQLPSYVDDVIEVANYAALPTTGETGKIYITIDNNHIFRWTGSTYVEITDNTAVWGAITGTLSSQSDLQSALNDKVPYTGATSNVNLGEYGLTSGYVGFDTTPTGTPSGIGTMYWDTANRTVSLIDGDGDTTLQIGQEERILVHNNTGSTLTDGQVVYVTGSTGELPSVSLANASNESTSAATIGVVTEAIANGADGFITTSGLIHGLNTLAFTEGDLLWLGNTAGTYTNIKPTSPNHLVLIGYVIKRAGGNGSILVKIQNTQELEESSDVLFTSLANNQVLTYESATSLWKNKSLSTILGYTAANDSNVVHLTGNESINGIKTFIGNSLILDPTGTTSIFTFKGSGALVAEFSFNSSFTQFSSRASGGYLFKNTASANALTIADNGNGIFLGNLTATAFIRSGGTSSQFLKADGSVDNSTYYLASNPNGYTSNLGTVTSVGALTLGTTGTDISSTVANGSTTPVITLNIPTASATNRGALSSTDWTTFNNKQNALTNPVVAGTFTANYLTKFTGSGTTISNSLIYDNGTNVGIGTTSPQVKFVVSNGGLQGIEFGYSAGLSANYIESFNRSNNLSVDMVYFLGSNAGNANHRFYTSASERMRITSGGNVGIGTTSPSSKLTLTNGSNFAHINGGGSNTIPFLGILNDSNYAAATYGWGIFDNSTNGNLDIKRYNGSTTALDVMTFQRSNGNVGIGTTAPTSKLHVSGLPSYADNTTALAGGLTVGAFYHTAGVLKVVI